MKLRMQVTRVFAAMASTLVCVANTPPEIGPMADVMVYVGSAQNVVGNPIPAVSDAVTVPIPVSDAETPVGSLTVSARSNVLSPVRTSDLTVAFRDGRWELSIRHAPEGRGTANLTVTATDSEGGQGSRSFLVRIQAGPLAVQVDPISPQRVWQDGPWIQVPVSLKYTGADAPLIRVTADPTNLVETTMGFAVVGNVQTRVIRLTPHAGAHGLCQVTLSASYPSTKASVTFPVVVEPASFAKEQLTLPPGLVGATEVLSADMNRDGVSELVALSSGVRVYQRTADGWNESGTSSVAPGLMDLGLVDFDRDGRVDIHARSLNTPYLLRNEDNFGKLRLVRQLFPLPAGSRVDGWVWADMDGDGRTDAVLVRLDGVSLLRNKEEGFELLDLGRLVMGPRLVAADMDRDGDLDVVAVRRTGVGSVGYRDVSIWWNDGTGRLTEASQPVYQSTAIISVPQVLDVGVVDSGGPRSPDVWCLVRDTQGLASRLVLLREEATGFAKYQEINTDAQSASQFAIADFDSDGTLDLAHSVGRLPPNRTERWDPALRRVEVWRGAGGGMFVPWSVVSASTFGVSAVKAEQQELMDLRIDRMRLLNLERRENIPPSAPVAPRVIQGGRRVRFVWGQGFDLNQEAPLTYNLRVGTQPGADDVVASMSLPGGKRMVNAAGNAGANTFKDLNVGRGWVGPLYWSVQAVDNSYSGSAFTEEQVFFPNLPEGDAVGRMQLSWIRPGAAVPLPRLTGRISPAQAFLLQSSGDLMEWMDEAWIQPRADGLFDWTRSGGSSPESQRFFRVTAGD